MNPTESATEKVFTALRDATPPPGMETRILHALESQAAAHPRPRLLTLQSIQANLTSHPVLATSFACALTAAAALTIFQTHRQTPIAQSSPGTPSSTRQDPGAPSSPAVSSLAKVGSSGELQGKPGAPSLPGVTSPVRVGSINPHQKSHHPGAPSFTREEPGAPSSPAVSSLAKVGSSGESKGQPPQPPETATNTPGFPAPPMPLTDQERLLLKIAHLGDPQELALLNPQARALHRAADDNAFKDFFAEPPIGDQSENQ